MGRGAILDQIEIGGESDKRVIMTGIEWEKKSSLDNHLP